MEEKKQVFISYKTEEFDEANWVKTVLEDNGISCWMAPMCIKGGASYATEIPQAIRNCKVFVLILSEKSQLSKWVPRELDQAINESKIIMPFMLENCKLKDDFNFYLTNVQRYAAYESKAAAIEKMLRELRGILGIEDLIQQEEVTQKEIPEENLEDIPEKVQEQPKPEKIESPKVKKVHKPRETKKKGTLPLGVGVVFGGIVALILICVIVSSASRVTIAGTKVKKSTYALRLSDVKLTEEDFEKIGKLKDLTNISFQNCTLPNKDLGEIIPETIWGLELNNCNLNEKHIASIDFSKLTKLTNLSLDDNIDIGQLDALKEVGDTVTELSLANTSLENLDMLSDFTKLVSINVNGNKLVNLKGLEKCIELEELWAGYNELDTLEGLENTTILRIVYLNRNNLTDIQMLESSVETLESLYIDNNQISDISALGKNTKLICFSANSNKLTGIEALAGKPELTKISVAFNQLSSLQGLQDCTNLSYLNASDNQILETEILAALKLEVKQGLVWNLGNNEISEVKVPEEIQFDFMDVHGNDLVNMKAFEACKCTRLVFDYGETIDYEKLKESESYEFYILNCPLDKQVEVKEILGDYYTKFCVEEEVLTAFEEKIPDSIKGSLKYWGRE